MQDRAFYDVFISYRHRDGEQISSLEAKIRAAGFEPFRDLNFANLGDPGDVTRAKIETIRRELSRATCLIFAYSRASAVRDQVAGQSLGVWMPWELGFFDGAISARIGVYLLDGPRGAEEPKSYYRGCEYLQLYEELTAETLEGFLRRNAVRERRIDNVAAAFAWLEHLSRECWANPANVNLGIAEWFADHAARFWQEHGNATLAIAFGQMKVLLDDVRVTAAPAWRLKMFDTLDAMARGGGGSLTPVANAATLPPRDAAGAMSFAPQGPPPEGALQLVQEQYNDTLKAMMAALQGSEIGPSGIARAPNTDSGPAK